MRVLRKPPAPKPRKVECRPGCGALLEVEESDCRLVYDPRDGDAYVCRCPCCGRDIWIAVKAWEAG